MGCVEKVQMKIQYQGVPHFVSSFFDSEGLKNVHVAYKIARALKFFLFYNNYITINSFSSIHQ